MTEERATVRIPAELLKRIDEAVEDDINIANRSHFFRVAAEEKLQIQKGEYIIARIPEKLRELLSIDLNSGYYNSIDDIIVDSLRVRYNIEKQREKLIEEYQEQDASTLQVMSK